MSHNNCSPDVDVAWDEMVPVWL